MKLKFLIFLFCITLRGVVLADPMSNENVKQLRLNLDADSTLKMDEKYAPALKAYVDLMELGPSGFEVLSEAWAYDHIPEEKWLQWSTDFLQRFVDKPGGNNATDDAYANYLDGKMAKSDKFAAASARRLLETKIYDDQALLVWLQNGIGSRRVGYMALKQRHPDLPAFDYQAGAEERKQQLQGIDAFLKSKKTGP